MPRSGGEFTERSTGPFTGAYDLLSVGYYSGPVEALSECVFDQGSWCGMVTTDPTMDITQQALPLLNGDAALQDLGVALPVELTLNNDKGLGATRESSSLCFVHR